MNILLDKMYVWYVVYYADYRDGSATRDELNAIVRAIQALELYHYGEIRTKEVAHAC